MMRRDTDAVGGFFEDLPVMAFVLAGVLSVAGTASWTAGRLADIEGDKELAAQASRVVTSLVAELGAAPYPPSSEGLGAVNISAYADSVPPGYGCMVSIWCVHPEVLQLPLAATGEVGPGESCAYRSFVNVACDDGSIGILEVRAVVWEAG